MFDVDPFNRFIYYVNERNEIRSRAVDAPLEDTATELIAQGSSKITGSFVLLNLTFIDLN